MFTNLKKFYASKFGNHVHCTIIIASLCSCFIRVVFVHNPIEYEVFSNILLIDSPLTDTTTPGQGERESNGNKRVFHTPLNSETVASHQMQFNVIYKTSLLYSPVDTLNVFQVPTTGRKFLKRWQAPRIICKGKNEFSPAIWVTKHKIKRAINLLIYMNRVDERLTTQTTVSWQQYRLYSFVQGM